MSWPTANGATSYKIVRNGQESFVGNVTTINDSNVTPSTAYTYGVSACVENACSDYIYAALTTTPAAPVTSSSVAVSSSSASVLKATLSVQTANVAHPYIVSIIWTDATITSSTPATYRIIRNGQDQALQVNSRGVPSWGFDDPGVEIGSSYTYTVLVCAGSNGCTYRNIGSVTINIPRRDQSSPSLVTSPSAPSAISSTVNNPSKLGIPSSGLKLTMSEDGITEIITLNKPNASGVSYNNINTVEANRPIKIINTADAFGNAAAKLIIIDAVNISLNNSIDIIGETADILFLAHNGVNAGSISCLTCTFRNFGRVTLANATASVGPFTSTVGVLKETASSMLINNLSAPGVASVELIAGDISNYGTISTQLRANFNAQGGYNVVDDGALVVGAGGVNIYNGRFNIDYETSSIKKIVQASGLHYISSKINASSIRITAASPLAINGELSTQSDILMNTIYKNTLMSVQESIDINNTPPTAVDTTKTTETAVPNLLGTMYVNGAVKSDFNVNLNSAGNIYLNGDLEAKTLQAIAIGKIVNTNKSAVETTTASLAANRFENNGSIKSVKLTVLAMEDLQNRFGGKMYADTISLVSTNSVVRNGSQYPYIPQSEIDADLMSLPMPMLASHKVNATDLTALSTVVDITAVNYIRVTDLSAKLVGRDITISANVFENINPSYSKTKEGDGFRFDKSMIDNVVLIANESLKIKATSSVLNSSAIMGVNQPTTDKKFIISSPNINNERYLTRAVIDVVDVSTSTPQIVTTDGSTSTSTFTSKNLEANLYVYSPPGIIYSFSAINFDFPGSSNTRGFVNNTAYFEALSDIHFSGATPLTVKTIGLALEKEQYATKATTITQVKDCYYYDGTRKYYYGSCTQTTSSSGNSSGATVETDMEKTLFSVLGNTYGSTVDFKVSTHDVLNEAKDNVFQALANNLLYSNSNSTTWNAVNATYTVSGENVTVTANYVTKSGTNQTYSTTQTYSVWTELTKAFAKIKSALESFLTWLGNL